MKYDEANDKQFIAHNIPREFVRQQSYYMLTIHSWQHFLIRWYPAKRALSAMRKHGGYDPFDRMPSNYEKSFFEQHTSSIQVLFF